MLPLGLVPRKGYNTIIKGIPFLFARTMLDVAETRGFALSVPKAKNVLKGLPRATHCTDRTQASGNVTPTFELCPPLLTFWTKVRARRDVSEEGKKMTMRRLYMKEPGTAGSRNLRQGALLIGTTRRVEHPGWARRPGFLPPTPQGSKRSGAVVLK